MKKLLKTIPYLIIAILVGTTVAYAGSLTPPGAPAKTMKTLANLYELINTGANTPSTDFTTPSPVVSTMNSLGDVYDLMATKITAIDVSKILTGTAIFGKNGSAVVSLGNAIAGNVLAGKYFSNTTTSNVLGTMTDQAAKSYTPSNVSQTITAGYYNGSGNVNTDANLITGNILSGKTIFGVSGKTEVVDTTEASVPIAVGTVLATKVGFVNGSKITGTMTNVGAQSITPTAAGVAITAGYHNGSGGTIADADLVEGNIKSGVNIFNVSGTAMSPPSVPAVGSTYGGGKVAYFFVNDDPGYVAGEVHGLIAATADSSTGIQWYNGSSTTTGATGTTLGTGSTNTGKIMGNQGATYTSYAAGLCQSKTDGTFTDWYLPSKDELNKLYLNKTAIGGFATNYYWSSSESSASNAWLQLFSDGSQPNYNKLNALYVRCVRAF